MTLADWQVVLDKGVIQQIGTPEDSTVAQLTKSGVFYRSPSMEPLRDARLTGGGFQLGPATIRTALDWSGEAVVGVRPEHIMLVDSGIPASLVLGRKSWGVLSPWREGGRSVAFGDEARSGHRPRPFI